METSFSFKTEMDVGPEIQDLCPGKRAGPNKTRKDSRMGVGH